MRKPTKSLAIFGGSFDPFHLGHAQILQTLGQRPDLDRILIVPTRQSPHKQAVASVFDRANMLRFGLKSLRKSGKILVPLSIWKGELNRLGPSYSVDTVSEIGRAFPHHPLIMVMGSDSFFSFHTWKSVNDILSRVRVAVIDRDEQIEARYQAYLETHFLPTYHKQFDYIPMKLHPASSTQIRSGLLSKGLPLYLDQDVESYIHKRSLYGHKRFKTVGITGRVGSGKSYAVDLLSHAFDIEVIDLDRVGHDALKQSSVQSKLRKHFGDSIFGKAGEVDRKSLGDLVFSDFEKLKRLNQVVHPWMRSQVRRLMMKNSGRHLVIVGALIRELGLISCCDVVICLDGGDEAIRAKVGDKFKISSFQRSRDAYQADADAVVFNDYSDMTKDRLFEVWRSLLT